MTKAFVRVILWVAAAIIFSQGALALPLGSCATYAAKTDIGSTTDLNAHNFPLPANFQPGDELQFTISYSFSGGFSRIRNDGPQAKTVDMLEDFVVALSHGASPSSMSTPEDESAADSGVSTAGFFLSDAATAPTLTVTPTGHFAVNPHISYTLSLLCIPAPAIPTQTHLVSSLNPSPFGQSVTFTATVSAQFLVRQALAAPAAPSPAGTVEFFDGSESVGTATLSDGVAIISISNLTAGSHDMTAVYQGTATTGPGRLARALSSNFAASTSNTLRQVVNAPPVVQEDVLGEMQDAATSVIASLSSEMITDTVGQQIGNALNNNVQVVSASDGHVGFVYAPNLEGRDGQSGAIVPTADVGYVSGSMWRIWTDLRLTDWNSDDLDGDQVNGLAGVSANLGNGVAAGLLTGYESFDYNNAAGAKLDGTGFTFGAYAGGGLDNGLRFDAQLHHTWLDYDVASGAVSGDFTANRLIASGGIAKRFDLSSLIIEPQMRATGTWEWQNGYTDSSGFAHDDQSQSFGRISGGLKLAKAFDMEGAVFTPFLAAYGDYRWSKNDSSIDQILDGTSGRASAGFDVVTDAGIAIGVSGEILGLGLDDHARATSVRAGVTIPF